MSNAIPLRNDHYVYILGAGYSAARGLPLIAGFLNRMRDAAVWCESNGRTAEATAIHDVLRFRLDAAAAAYRVPIDLENIEELFSLASAADPKIAKSVTLSIAATLAYCSQTYPDPELHFNNRSPTVGDIKPFAMAATLGDSSTQKVNLFTALAVRVLQVKNPSVSSVITFNYDDLIERSIAEIGGTYHYGFGTDHELESGVPYSREGVPILKLHGSINWAYARGQGKKFTVYKDYESLRLHGLTPQIVPPTWNKAIKDRLSEVWASAIDRLATATKVIVIGFSMPRTDLHFKYLLAAGMKNNFSLREIVFVDPSEAIEERARDVLAAREIDNKRVRFISSTVQELLGTSVHFGRYMYNNVGGRPF